MCFNKIIIKSIPLALFTGCLISFAACVQVKKASLYDGVEMQEPTVKPADLSLIVQPIIYDDDVTDVWGLEKNNCQEAEVTDAIAYRGNESLQITWNRNADGCDWSGIGIGWDGYAGKDLSEIMDFAAIQMFVRTQEGRAFGLPMVLTLEDYSGGMGFSYTGNKYFERTVIDEEWQKVLVPLSSFEIDKENLDPSNIKQLQIELQQSGSIYLDDIRLVFYEPEPQEAWLEEEKLPDPLEMPIQIFSDTFINNNGWGLISDVCQTIKLSEKAASEGKQSLYLKWDNYSGDCKLMAFGVSWNKWHPVDVTAAIPEVAIEFDIKTISENMDQLPIKVGFEDYDRAKTFISLESKFVAGGKYTNDWKKVRVPFSAIPQNIDFTNIKQLYFDLEKSGEVYIDNIRLVKN